MPRSTLVLGFACAALAVACGRSASSPGTDAAVAPADGGLPLPDAIPAGDSGTLYADFAAVGCDRVEDWAADGGTAEDGGAAHGLVCIGFAPLTLTMVPLTSPEVDAWSWTFGDESADPVSGPTPTHTFVRPGAYDVWLTVRSPAGTLAVHHTPPFVQVLPNPIGAPCEQSDQCEPGLTCRCGAGTSCGAAFGFGLCTRECEGDEDCGAGAVCVDLALSAARDPLAQLDPWRRLLCLPACDALVGCGRGLSCRELPAAGGAGAWVHACSVAVLGDVGAPCRDATGKLVHSACAGGLCLGFGAGGYCSAACGLCPTGSACVRVDAGDGVCLVSCPAACDEDPLLACDLTGAELGDPAAAAGPYCAPRRCQDVADCGGLPCEPLGEVTVCGVP